jgi:hypothetical protein
MRGPLHLALIVAGHLACMALLVGFRSDGLFAQALIAAPRVAEG